MAKAPTERRMVAKIYKVVCELDLEDGIWVAKDLELVAALNLDIDELMKEKHPAFGEPLTWAFHTIVRRRRGKVIQDDRPVEDDTTEQLIH